MKEVRPPKRPLIFYYCVAMLVLLLFNFLAMPWMAKQQVREVDYGTFMDMAENHQLGQVEIQETENQIVFTDKDSFFINYKMLISYLANISFHCFKS